MSSTVCYEEALSTQKPNQTALVIFDEFKGQVIDDVYNMLESNNIQVVKVSSNCTDRLQPMDLSINKPVKDFFYVTNFRSGIQKRSRMAMVNQEM